MLLQYTYEELMTEWLEDRIEQDPEEAYPEVTTGDNVVFRRTGDKVVDKWEKQIAKGEEIDPFEGVPVEDRARIERMLKRKAQVGEVFSDTYDKGSVDGR